VSEVTEQELAAKAVAPRVTKDQIDALIEQVTVRIERPEGSTSTFAHVYLGQFYLASGHSACISVENYDPAIGERIARGNGIKKATDQLWQMEGYALFKKLNPGFGTTFQQRLVAEREELEDRYAKLSAFNSGEVFTTLPVEDQNLLMRQQAIMAELHLVIAARLARLPA
jgi:hypothetical protein